jgi:hypothetical protein
MHQRQQMSQRISSMIIIFSEDGPNLVKRDRNITISLGQGPFYGSIGIGLVHTMSNMLNKTIQVANSSKRQLFQGMTCILQYFLQDNKRLNSMFVSSAAHPFGNVEF